MRGSGVRRNKMIQKIIHKGDLRDFSEIKDNLVYWLSRPPEERVGAVERLRRERHGSEQRMQGVVTVKALGDKSAASG